MAVFTQTQVVLSGIRLTFDENIAQTTSDLGPQIEDARRTFVHTGDVTKAIQDIGRIAATYRQRVQSWEAEANRRENNKQAFSGEKIAKMKAEHSRVRTKAMLGDRSLTKLTVELHQLSSTDLKPTEVVISNRPTVQAVEETKQDDIEVQIPEEQLQKYLRAVESVLENVITKEGQVFRFDSGKFKHDPLEGVDQVWGEGGALAVIASWSVVEKEVERSYGEPDYSLSRSGKPMTHRDLRIWLVPRTPKAAESLETIYERLDVVLSGFELDKYRLDFSIGDLELLDKERLPLSKKVANWIRKTGRKVAESHPMCLVYADLRQLELKQNEMLLQVRTTRSGDS